MLMGHTGGTRAARALVVIPVKPLTAAKSRLRNSLGGHTEGLVLAMAQDVVAAAVAAPAVGLVLVVSDDPEGGSTLIEAGAVVVPDHPGQGLNSALRFGAEHGAGDQSAVVAVMADLPCVTAADLDALARLATTGRCFVPDAAGTGTTCLGGPTAAGLMPAFGADSRDRHAKSGATELSSARWHRLRRDVDTDEDLQDARRIGVGPATAAWLAARRKSGAP